MGKPRLLIIIRHAQSEGNRDKAIHQNTPDHRVGLTEEGHQQAREAGEKLRALLREDDTLHFFISPYKRTRQTTEGILSTLCSNEPAPSPFQRHHIKVYEEPRLREQDFGNFQPGGDETERLWRERASYGHFFYRIPNGESGADVYDRVSAFNGSLWRRFNEDEMASIAVLVTHGLCSRIFLMAWYHYSVEFFEDLRNINHCEFLVMKLGQNGKYTLQNQLRRWTDLKRERAARKSISAAAASPPAHIPVRRWGSLAKGNNPQPPQIQLPVRQNTADLFKDDEDTSENKSNKPTSPSVHASVTQGTSKIPLKAGDDRDQENSLSGREPRNKSLLSYSLQQLATDGGKGARLSTKSYLGRDGGGSRSGAASPSEMSSGEDTPPPTATSDKDAISSTQNAPISRSAAAPITIQTNSLARALRGDLDEPGRVLADALGDYSEPEVDKADEELGIRDRERREMANIIAEEVRERSHRGDVY